MTLAVLSNRDGNLSSIYRHLTRHYEKLVRVIGQPLRLLRLIYSVIVESVVQSSELVQ